jgi:hypothetical protein
MRLLKFHPFVTKIFMMIVLSTRHPHFICGRSSSFYSYDQCRIQCVSRKITCIGLRTHTLSNITSFWLNHIARQKVHTSIRILYICFLSIPYTHPLNIWWIFKGGDILKETYIILQMYLAHGQSKKRCCIDLSMLHQQHFKLSFHLFFARLSLATPLIIRRTGRNKQKYNICTTGGRETNWMITHAARRGPDQSS